MRRFLSGLGSGLGVIAVLGAVLLAFTGDAPEPPRTSSEVLAQVEDDSEAADDTVEPLGDQLMPIQAYLAQIFPTAEGEQFPSAQRVVLSRDPFNPVVPEDPATDGDGTDGDGTDGDGTDGDGTDGDGTDGDGTDGDGTDGDGTDGGQGDACSGDEQETVCDGVVVTLDGFTDDGEAIVSVDGTTFTVGREEEFATSFRVLAINEPCVTLLFGDEAFSICTGATVLK